MLIMAICRAFGGGIAQRVMAGFVRGLEVQLVGYAETRKDRKSDRLSG
jgi:hypothetical protein